MIKKFLIAAALVIASPALVFSQDIFWSFDQTSATSTGTGAAGTSGTAFIFSDGMFGFDALDLNFTSSDSSVLLLTGGTGTNPEFLSVGGTRFDSSVVTINSGSDGNLFAVNVAQNGVNTALGPLFDPGFDANVGPNGGVLLAEITYDVVGAGDATLDFSLGTQGALQLPLNVLNPTFGSGTFTGTGGGGGGPIDPTIPEPSSAVLLILGSVGLFTRRNRA